MAVLATALVTVSCGSSRDDEVVLPGPRSPTGPLIKTDYIRQANEICRAADAAIVERTNSVGQPGLSGSADESKALVDAIAPIAEQAMSRLKNLTPPPEDRALLQRVTEPMQQTLDRARREPGAFVNPIRQVDPELYQYGLTGCYER